MKKLIEKYEQDQVDEAMRGFESGVGEMIGRADIAIGQGLGYLWKAADAFDQAGEKDLTKKMVSAINDVARLLKDSDPEYEEAVRKIARKVEGRGSKFSK